MVVETVGVLPWLEIRKAIQVGNITVFPAEEAINLVGDRGEVLRDRLQIYRHEWDAGPVASSVAIHADQLVTGGEIPFDELRRAIDILMTAAVFKNDGTPGFDVNATTFTLFIQRLGGDVGGIALRLRRRNGGILAGGMTSMIVSKPSYAARYMSHDPEILDALVQSIDVQDAWHLYDALEWFRRGSTDAENVDVEVDYVLLLTAVDFLLAHPNSTLFSLDQARIATLLAPFDPIPCCCLVKTKEVRSQIQAALRVLNETRNATVHTRAFKPEGPYGFQLQSRNTLAWIGDRCFMALLVARLVELGTLKASPEKRAFVRAVSEWLVNSEPELGKRILDVKLRVNMQELLRNRHHEEVEATRSEQTGEVEERWRRDFFVALGEGHGEWRVAVGWLENGSGVIEIFDAATNELRDYMLFDPATDEASRMAYATRGWIDAANAPPIDQKRFRDEPPKDFGWIQGDRTPG